MIATDKYEQYVYSIGLDIFYLILVCSEVLVLNCVLVRYMKKVENNLGIIYI
jgi:hypothetical protein